MLAETYTEKATCKTKMAIVTKLKSNKPHQKARTTADCIQEKKKNSCASTATQCESSESEDDADTVCVTPEEGGWTAIDTASSWAGDVVRGALLAAVHAKEKRSFDEDNEGSSSGSLCNSSAKGKLSARWGCRLTG